MYLKALGGFMAEAGFLSVKEVRFLKFFTLITKNFLTRIAGSPIEF